MVVYSVNSETEWNQLARQSVHAALTSSDIVHIDTSFSFTAYPETVYLGAGLLNGRTNTIIFNIAADKGGDVNMISLAGGTVRTLKLTSTNSGIVRSVLLHPDSYGTVRNCELSGFTIDRVVSSYGGCIISNRSSKKKLTLSRIKATGITLKSTLTAVFVGSGTNVIVSKCSTSFTSMTDTHACGVAVFLTSSTVTECTSVSSSGGARSFSEFINGATACTISICRFICGTTSGYMLNDCGTSSTVTDCLASGVANFAASTTNAKYTRCVLLGGAATTPFFSAAFGTNTVTSCVSSTLATGNNSVTGVLTSATAFSGAGATAGFGFAASENWSDAISGFPLLKAFQDTNEFTGGYTSATATTVVRVPISTEADTSGLTAPTPTSGHAPWLIFLLMSCLLFFLIQLLYVVPSKKLHKSNFLALVLAIAFAISLVIVLKR